MNFSFSADCRLKNTKDFSYMRDRANRTASPYFMIYSKPSRLKLKNSRLGISVSKKSGNAVARNKLKRLIREAFRNSEIKSAGLDLMLVVSKIKVKKGFTKNQKNLSSFSEALTGSLAKIS